MRDYDVEALSLAVPPVIAPVAAYRPAVLVRNNGIYPANVTGTMRVYRREPQGDLLATFAISLAALQPGATGSAQASQYWTPTAADVGREFLFAADITTANDQLESNNHLSPVTVIVVGGEPEPPLPVEAHAPQHEAGGADEVNVEDLHGALADPQVPVSHKARHQLAGDDVIDVTNLNGVLAEPQNPKLHAGSHAIASSDPLNVETLVGATGLEHVANKGVANGYAALDNDILVPWTQLATGSIIPPGPANGLRSDRLFGPVKATNIGDNRQSGSQLPGPTFEDLHTIAVPAAWMHDHMLFEISLFGQLILDNLGLVELRLCYGAASWCTISIPGTSDPDRHWSARAVIAGVPVDYMTGYIDWLDDGQSTHEITRRMNHKTQLASNPNADRTWTVQARITSGGIDSLLTIYSAAARSLRPQP